MKEAQDNRVAEVFLCKVCNQENYSNFSHCWHCNNDLEYPVIENKIEIDQNIHPKKDYRFVIAGVMAISCFILYTILN